VSPVHSDGGKVRMLTHGGSVAGFGAETSLYELNPARQRTPVAPFDNAREAGDLLRAGTTYRIRGTCQLFHRGIPILP